jgi:hypothetical protein
MTSRIESVDGPVPEDAPDMIVPPTTVKPRRSFGEVGKALVRKFTTK